MDKILAKILSYNDLFEKGISFIYALSNDYYLEDLAETNNYNSADDFINDLNAIWYESYKKPFLENNPNWEDELRRLNNALNEIKKTSSYDRKQLELNDSKEAKKLYESLINYAGELELYFNGNNQPIYDMEAIERILNNQKDTLLKSKGKKSRKAIYNDILDTIESCKL